LALFWGLIRPYKGVDLLLEAIARLGDDSPWRLIVAGEPWGGSGAELEAAVSRLRLASRARLELGWVSEDRIAELLGAADVVVLPYRSGSQSAVAPRALAAGVPVLTTRVGGLPELVRDAVDGRVVEPGSAAALADALAALDDAALGGLRDGAVAAAGRLQWPAYAEAVASLAARVADRFVRT
jgi:glycosyltransferase involved in cell wall biosynthesis